jgi:cytochrome c1
VIVMARAHGADYIRSLLIGYDEEPPEDVDVRPGLYWNPYFSGGQIAMAPQLIPDRVTYEDGTEATPEQMAEDVVTFLAWASEPHQEARKKLGFTVLIYLTILAVLLWFSYKQIWRNVKH